jgi:hypothetical protein
MNMPRFTAGASLYKTSEHYGSLSPSQGSLLPSVQMAAGGCKTDIECPPGYRCAKWAFKKNECVQTCINDALGHSNCPVGQVCRQPFGTSFPRCVND